MTLLRPDGTQFPGSPFTGGGLPGPLRYGRRRQRQCLDLELCHAEQPDHPLCGARMENCPPGFKTGDQISPPGGYVGGGLQMQTDLAVIRPVTSG